MYVYINFMRPYQVTRTYETLHPKKYHKISCKFVENIIIKELYYMHE